MAHWHSTDEKIKICQNAPCCRNVARGLWFNKTRFTTTLFGLRKLICLSDPAKQFFVQIRRFADDKMGRPPPRIRFGLYSDPIGFQRCRKPQGQYKIIVRQFCLLLTLANGIAYTFSLPIFVSTSLIYWVEYTTPNAKREYVCRPQAAKITPGHRTFL